MVMSKALAKLTTRFKTANTAVCVGLDSGLDRLPAKWLAEKQPQLAYNTWVIDQTAEFSAAFKLNTAFYEAAGADGWQAMAQTVKYVRQHHPDILTIADAKRADIGSTNQGYVTALIDEIGFDAITLHPYLGQEALEPFLNRPDILNIILCRTSNPGAGEFQDLQVQDQAGKTQPLWAAVAQHVAESWNDNGNCMLVVGATYPDEMAQIRQLVGPNLPFLVPGVGAQGGDVAAVVAAGQNAAGTGLLVNSSRGIILAEKPRLAARELRDQIQAAAKTVKEE